MHLFLISIDVYNIRIHCKCVHVVITGLQFNVGDSQQPVLIFIQNYLKLQR